jgi:hypothetical protein
MGTRSTYRIIEKQKEDQEQLALVYVQYDGYPSGHPSRVAEWLSGAMVVNGFNTSTPTLAFNGAGCLAARFVGYIKEDRIGNVYLYPFKYRANCGEDYMYDIIVDESESTIKMIAYDYNDNKMFEGTPQEFASKYSKQTV